MAKIDGRSKAARAARQQAMRIGAAERASEEPVVGGIGVTGRQYEPLSLNAPTSAEEPHPAWAAIQAVMSREEFAGYLRGNALQYLSRYRSGNSVADTEMARRYIVKLLEELTRE